MQTLIIHKLGPIEDCRIECKKSMVITGFQASGKSTIAKAVFFFRTIKEDIISVMKAQALNNAGIISDGPSDLKSGLLNVLRDKFLRTFGSSWAMSHEMLIEFHFNDESFAKVSLKNDTIYDSPNYIWIELSPSISRYLHQNDNVMRATQIGVTPAQEDWVSQELAALLSDPYETVYIPAGRSLLTLLSNQLSVIYSQMDKIQKRSLDYCTQNYIERILTLKPLLSNGIHGLLEGRSIPATMRRTIQIAEDLIYKVLKGTYQYVGSEERLILQNNRYVKLNFASSGQQEAVWIANLLFYYITQKENVFFIIEEPESHLFPESQKHMTELIALAHNLNFPALVTTHSPYVLGTFNNLLYAGGFPEQTSEEVSKIIPEAIQLEHNSFDAWFVKDGAAENCVDKELHLIQNERIDEISKTINADYDKLFAIELEQGNQTCL